MSIYYFRAVMAGVCAECDQLYGFGDLMHLTAGGITHPGCDPQTAPANPPAATGVARATAVAAAARARKKKKPRKAPVSATSVRYNPHTPRPADTATTVCRTCWCVHPAGTDCK